MDIRELRVGDIVTTNGKNIKYLHQLQHELFDARVEFKIELY